MSRASRQIGIRGEVNVLLTSNADMRRLNRQYRKKNVATDVLSFPAPDVKGVTGDIAISLEIAKQSAKTRSELLEQEVCILILHGLLHLAGFDHEKDNGVMKR
jgi:probable rRNA maturation factor